MTQRNQRIAERSDRCREPCRAWTSLATGRAAKSAADMELGLKKETRHREWQKTKGEKGEGEEEKEWHTEQEDKSSAHSPAAAPSCLAVQPGSRAWNRERGAPRFFGNF